MTLLSGHALKLHGDLDEHEEVSGDVLIAVPEQRTTDGSV